MYYLYIIESIQHKRWYIGISDNVLRRLGEHNQGQTISTRPYRPYELVYTETYQTKTEARKREIAVKRSGVIRKELKQVIANRKTEALSSNG